MGISMLLFTSPDAKVIVMDEEGNDRYETKPKEDFMGFIPRKELYQYVVRGNYEGIIDSNGNYLYLRFSNRLEE